jgi:aminoglycoside phosphotransferase (APT) family kinase protein
VAEQVDGIDAAKVSDWLRERTDMAPPLDFELIAGGRSNLTYRVTDATGVRWVLRRPPLHSVLASAHDVAREYRIMAALQPTPVPVPPLVGLEPDEVVIGAPFYVMEFVDGLVPRDADAVVAAIDEPARGRAAFALADTLADLHAVDIDAVGLGDLARREDYIGRQLRRWQGQYEKGGSRELPLVAEVHDRLAARIPDQGTAAIVHGDYRFDNMIVGPDGEIRAVLDWELCTLGDPLADVGLLAVYWEPPAGREMPMIPAAGSIPGMPAFREVAARYAERSGRDLGELDYYVAFGYWKLAIILEGVYARFSSGAYGATDGSHEVFGQLVLDLLELASDAAANVGR